MSMIRHLDLTVLSATLLGTVLAACARPSPAADMAAAALLMTPHSTTQSGRAVAPCPPVTRDIVEQGKKIFSGPGNCYSCHGTNAKGTPLAPDLTDQKWLQIDGNFPAIVKVIQTGVPQPTEHPAPMPPMGGAHLNESQVCAVGAYVFTLTHPIE